MGIGCKTAFPRGPQDKHAEVGVPQPFSRGTFKNERGKPQQRSAFPYSSFNCLQQTRPRCITAALPVMVAPFAHHPDNKAHSPSLPCTTHTVVPDFSSAKHIVCNMRPRSDPHACAFLWSSTPCLLVWSEAAGNSACLGGSPPWD